MISCDASNWGGFLCQADGYYPFNEEITADWIATEVVRGLEIQLLSGFATYYSKDLNNLNSFTTQPRSASWFLSFFTFDLRNILQGAHRLLCTNDSIQTISWRILYQILQISRSQYFSDPCTGMLPEEPSPMLPPGHDRNVEASDWKSIASKCEDWRLWHFVGLGRICCTAPILHRERGEFESSLPANASMTQLERMGWALCTAYTFCLWAFY